MLPSENQLKKEKDIERVFKKGKSFKEGFLVLKIINNDLENSRFGFVVSTKISKKASLRNKIKRRLRELVRARLKKIKTGADGLFVAVPGIEEKDFWEIEDTMNKIFLRAKLFNG